MRLHHLSMMDSALVRVFGLHEERELPEETPGIEVQFLEGVFEFGLKNNKNCVFDEILFGPL